MNKFNLIFLIFIFSFKVIDVFSQNTFKDTITIETIEINTNHKKPKVKKIVYGEKIKHFYLTGYETPRYYLIDSFPYGKVLEISLQAFNQKKYKGRFEGAGTRIKDLVFCDKTEHPVNIYEVVENNGVISLGKLLFTGNYLLPLDNARVEYKVRIDLSDLEIHTNRFFIELIDPQYSSDSDSCKIATYGFNIFENTNASYYFFDNTGNFFEKKGWGIQMDLKVLTREY